MKPSDVDVEAAAAIIAGVTRISEETLRESEAWFSADSERLTRVLDGQASPEELATAKRHYWSWSLSRRFFLSDMFSVFCTSTGLSREAYLENLSIVMNLPCNGLALRRAVGQRRRWRSNAR